MPIYKKIVIFVEGVNDKRFFEKILRNRFERRYEGYNYHIIKYSQKSDEKKNKLINSFKEMNSKIFLFTDFDNGPCNSEIKSNIRRHVNLSDDKIFIIKKEIESWYLAGLNQQFLKSIGINEVFNNTEDISKGRFEALILGKSYLKIEMLNNYNFRLAMRRNSTFRYVIEKLNLN